MIVELVDGPNPWAEWNKHCPMCGREHCCYFCSRPGCYEMMPKFQTLCIRCGHLIRTPESDDPMNNAMVVCPGCEEDMAREFESVSS